MSYEALAVERYEVLPLWPRMQTLSANLSVYDATYVTLAESLGVPLITSDAGIAHSSVARCPVEIFA